MWKTLTISVGDGVKLPVVRGDVPFFRDVLASIASGGRFECAITGRVLGGEGGLNVREEKDMVDAREALREESYSRRRRELGVFEREEVVLFVYCLCLCY